MPATDGKGDIYPGHHGSCVIGEWPGLHHEGCGGGGGKQGERERGREDGV